MWLSNSSVGGGPAARAGWQSGASGARRAGRDVVFEPGCGDARITIAAITAGARRAICVDLDPERARVVSHRFTMGDWPPDKSITVESVEGGGTYELHLWTITEDVKRKAGRAHRPSSVDRGVET